MCSQFPKFRHTTASCRPWGPITENNINRMLFHHLHSLHYTISQFFTMKIRQSTVSIWTLLVSLCSSISIIPTNDANTLANGVFSGPGVTVVSASFTGAAGAAGTFSDGPFGIGAGVILTSGLAINALPGGDSTVANFAPGPAIYCGNGG